MALRRYGTFRGGIDLPEQKYATLDSPVQSRPLPERLQIPLAPCGQRPAEPTVTVGQHVRADQCIAIAPDSSSVHVFSPVSGRVAGITHVRVAGPESFIASRAIELCDLDDDRPHVEPHPDSTWQKADPATLRHRITEGGLTTCRRPLHPLAIFCDQAVEHSCHTLIANVMENQPYLTAEHRLLVEHGSEIITGLAILGRAIGATELIIAGDRRRIRLYPDMAAASSRYGVAQVALPHKYPIGADTVLVDVLTRRRPKPGATVMTVAAAVVSAATCLAVWRWVACGTPPTWQVVTVGGELADHPGNYTVPIGTPCSQLAETPDGPVIHGGPMTGIACVAQAVVTPATEAVLAIHTAPARPPNPCIRCGWCTDHCPVRLNVANLNDMFELSQLEDARRDAAAACVGCGVCSYVCPSRLPLTDRVGKLKRAIIASEQTNHG